MASSRRTGTTESRTTDGGTTWVTEVATFGTAGGGRHYTSVSTWESDTDVNLTSSLNRSPVLECYADATSYTVSVTVSGATTSATYRRIVRAALTARHGGVPGAGVKFIADGTVCVPAENYFCAQDLEFVTSTNNANPRPAIAINNQTKMEFVGLLLKATNSGSGEALGIRAPTADDSSGVVNCIAYECDEDGIQLRGASALAYNCTAVGCGRYGFSYSTTQPVWKNNIAVSNASGDYNGTGNTGTTHNLSSDATAPGTTNYQNRTVTFVNSAADDYRITNDADAVGQGTDLSADASFAFDDDIAYTTRS